MRHPIRGIPRNLLRQKVFRAGRGDDLRHRRGVAKGIGQPHLRGVDSELVKEEPLTHHELPGHGLRAGHVGVGFDPHAPYRNELPGSDLLLDAGEQARILVFDPRVLLRRGAREAEVGMPVHQIDHVGEGSRTLTDRLAHGPQPGRVDMRVTDSGDPVGTGIRRTCQDVGQLLASSCRGAREIVRIHRVQHAFQGAQDLVAARQILGEGVHQPVQRGDVLLQPPQIQVSQREVDITQPIQRVLTAGGLVSQRHRRPEVLADIRVGSGLDVEVHGSVRIVDGHEGIARCDALHHGAVRPIHQPFGVESRPAGETQLHAHFGAALVPAAPRRRNGPRHMQPHGRPRGAPRRPMGDLVEVLAHCLGERHRLAGCGPGGHRQGRRIHIDGTVQAFVDKAPNAVLNDPPIVMHGLPPAPLSTR